MVAGGGEAAESRAGDDNGIELQEMGKPGGQGDQRNVGANSSHIQG